MRRYFTALCVSSKHIFIIFIKTEKLRNSYFHFLSMDGKNDRLQRVEKYISTIHDLSAILGIESSMIITKVHPSLNELYGISKNISDSILAKLNSTVESLEDEKQQRLEKVNSKYHSFPYVPDLSLLLTASYLNPVAIKHTSLSTVLMACIHGSKNKDQREKSVVELLFHLFKVPLTC